MCACPETQGRSHCSDARLDDGRSPHALQPAPPLRSPTHARPRPARQSPVCSAGVFPPGQKQVQISLRKVNKKQTNKTIPLHLPFCLSPFPFSRECPAKLLPREPRFPPHSTHTRVLSTVLPAELTWPRGEQVLSLHLWNLRTQPVACTPAPQRLRARTPQTLSCCFTGSAPLANPCVSSGLRPSPSLCSCCPLPARPPRPRLQLTL